MLNVTEYYWVMEYKNHMKMFTHLLWDYQTAASESKCPACIVSLLISQGQTQHKQMDNTEGLCGECRKSAYRVMWVASEGGIGENKPHLTVGVGFQFCWLLFSYVILHIAAESVVHSRNQWLPEGRRCEALQLRKGSLLHSKLIGIVWDESLHLHDSGLICRTTLFSIDLFKSSRGTYDQPS